ncbi:MAG: flippase [Gammaproteobacteria bacterium]|nr:flippase [Gammaproteobacteria bacterium]
MSDKNDQNLIGGRRLARNVFWNLLGTGAPLLVAILVIPMLIEGLGTARFGVLTLAWMVVGYFSLFDLGLGRALTKLVAERLGSGQSEDIPALIWTAMSLMAVLGVFGAMVVAALSPWLVGGVLKIPLELQGETLAAFYLLAASIPVVIGTTGLRGVLEAHQRFGLVNAVRIPLGMLTFLGPLVVLPFSNSLVPVVAVLVIARLISWCVYAALCLKVDPTLRRPIRIRGPMVMPLVNFGGWMTVTNIVGPLMVYLDRFFIGAAVSMAAVAYYATPYDVVTKLWVVPGALMGVMFPAFAAALVKNRVRASLLFERTVNYIFLALFPVVLVVVTFANEGLNLWLGSEFADNSALVLQLLAIGVFVNSHAHVPFGMLQSAGRADLTAKLHLLELPLYLLTLWWLLDAYGITGAAIAWVLRVAVDTLILFVMADRLLSMGSPFSRRPMLLACSALVVLTFGAMITGFAVKGLFVALVLLIYVLLAWFVLLANDERDMIRRWLTTIWAHFTGNKGLV